MTATSHPQGSSFGNAINYIYEGRLDEHKDKKETLIMHSDTVRVPRDADDLKGRNRLKSDFISQAEAHKQYGNANRKNYVGHHSLNFSASDMAGLSPKKIEQITGDYIKDAGLNQTQYVAVAHADTELYHVHIIFNRATNNHTLYNDWREYNKTAERAVALNLKYGLSQEKKQIAMASSPEILAIRSGHEDIQKLRLDTLIGRAKNLHHLSKLCEIAGMVYGEINGIIRVGEKQYRQEDLQAVFYDNRSEDRAKVRQRHIEETSQRKLERVPQSQSYEIKQSKKENRDAERVAAELLAQERRAKVFLEQSQKLRERIEKQLKLAKATGEFIELLSRYYIKISQSKEDASIYLFENSEAQISIPIHQIQEQLRINRTPVLPELSLITVVDASFNPVATTSQKPEPSIDLESVKKTDNKEEEKKIVEQKPKTQRMRM